MQASVGSNQTNFDKSAVITNVQQTIRQTVCTVKLPLPTFENQLEQPHLAQYHEQYRQKLPRSIISNAYVHIFCFILKHMKTRAISGHRQRAYAFRSFISFSFQHQSRKSVRAYAFRSGAHFFTLTAPITISYKRCVENQQDHRVSARTRIYELHFIQDSALFVDCLTLAITIHHVHQYHSQYHSSENSTRACQIPLSIRKVIHSRPFLLRTSNSTALNQPCILHAIQSSTTHAY